MPRERGLDKVGLSRGVRQRLGRQRALRERASAAISGLNSLAGFDTLVANSPRELGELGGELLERTRAACQEHHVSVRPFAGIRPQEAHEALLGGCFSLYSWENSTVRPFDLHRVSLPPAGMIVKDLASLQEGPMRAMLEGHRSGMVRPRGEVMKERREGECPGLHVDPALLSRRSEYLDFVR